MLFKTQVPRIEELPPPPTGKIGWPWTEQSVPFPEQMLDGSEWPRISIVTPSYNQGQFIEETIRSVVLQGYPNLEYIIIDGGSTDNSVEIIKKYETWLSYWISEKDQGQSDAINKGFNRASGKICAYINSDDIYLPNTLGKVALSFFKNRNIKWLASSCLEGKHLSKENTLWHPQIKNFSEFVITQTIAQQGVFWVDNIIQKPYFRPDRQFRMDHQFFVEIYLTHGLPYILNDTTAFFRQHPDSKTSNLLDLAEKERQMLAIEIMKKVDSSTANKIFQLNLRARSVFEISQILNLSTKKSIEKWHLLVKAFSIFTNTPFPLRDRIFVSALIKLFLGIFTNFNLLQKNQVS